MDSTLKVEKFKLFTNSAHFNQEVSNPKDATFSIEFISKVTFLSKHTQHF
jgi:hypothetical protein